MKRACILFSILLFTLPFVRAQNATEQKLVEFINSGENLSLYRYYQTAKDSVQTDVVKLLSEAFIHSALNQPKEASEEFLELITNHQENLGLSGIMSMLGLLADNMRYTGNYKSASELVQSILEQTATFEDVDSLTRTKLANQIPLSAFGDSYKPEIIRPNRDCEVPLLFGEGALKEHLHIPVTINGREIPFIFDTGADGFGTNFVIESFAKENGIRILDDSIKISGIVASSYARLGILDSMQIGDIVYRNVAFMIASDTDILATHMNAVLGSAFMKAIGEIQIYPQEKKIK